VISALRLIGATHTRRGALTDVPGTIRRIAEQPIGPLALAIIAVGLLSYALWRFLPAFLDSEHEGRTFQALSTRAGYLGRGLIYAGIAAYAIRGVFGPAHLRQGDTLPKWSARLMSNPPVGGS